MTQNTIIKKGLIVVIVLLFVGTTFNQCTANSSVENQSQPASNGNTLYVGGNGPGNYSRIQDAIDNASDGDTIFVYDDSSPYYEKDISIEKSINLIGENHNTVIREIDEPGNSVNVRADFVSINCFSIIGPHVYVSGDNAVISNIYFISNPIAISLIGTKNSIISNNSFKNCRTGLELAECSNNLISQNEITGCEDGFIFYVPASHNTIINNEITKNVNGIHFKGFYSYYRRYDRIENTNIQYNNITNNSIGINILGKFRNGVIENNNFVGNKESIHFNIFPGQRLKINANFWGETKLLPQIIPGCIIIYLYTDYSNQKNPYDIFLYLPHIVFDWNPARRPYNIGEG